MVFSHLINYLFYEETPACILLGFEINDDQICDEITKSFDAVFYILFITICVIMLLRLTKIAMIFVKVIEYLLILRSCKGSANMTDERKLFTLMKVLQSQNDSYFSIWRKKSVKILCKHNRYACSTCDLIGVTEDNGGVVSRFFKTLYNKLAPQFSDVNFEDNIKDVKLIFINDKYSTKSLKSRKFMQLKECQNKVTQDVEDVEIVNETVENVTSVHTFVIDNTNNIQCSEELKTVGAELKVSSSRSNVTNNETTSSQEYTPMQAKSDTSSCENALRHSVSRSNNKYLQKVFHLIPIPEYPEIVFEKNQMRFVVKKFVSSANSTKRKPYLRYNNQTCSKICSLKKIEYIHDLTSIAKGSESNLVPKNSGSIKSDNSYNSIKSESGKSVKFEDKSALVKRNEIKKANIMAKIKENKRKNLMKYLDTINTDRKRIINSNPQVEKSVNDNLNNATENKPSLVNTTNAALLRRRNFMQNKIIRPIETKNSSRKVTFKIKHESPINVGRVNDLSDGTGDYTASTDHKKDTLHDKYITDVVKSENNSATKQPNDIDSVRDDLVNTLVNLPKDTFTSMKNRYKMQRNKSKKVAPKNSLDVILETSSRCDIITSESTLEKNWSRSDKSEMCINENKSGDISNDSLFGCFAEFKKMNTNG